mgnify:CR=1 FL=1
MKENNYLDILAEDLQEIEQALDTLDKKLMPHLSQLTNKQRRYMPKLGINKEGFVRNAIEYVEFNPELLPSFIELKDLKREYEKLKLFQNLFLSIETIHRGLRDSIMDAGNKLVEGSFLIYNNVKIAAKVKINGAMSAYKELKDSYPGRGPSRKNQEDVQ